ncbi:hypothetical protein CLOM_g13617, partial [Closterium sp. NIES-68]
LNQGGAAAAAPQETGGSEGRKDGRAKRVMEGGGGEGGAGAEAGALRDGVTEAGGSCNGDVRSRGDCSGPELKRSKAVQESSSVCPPASPQLKELLGNFSLESLKGIYKGISLAPGWLSFSSVILHQSPGLKPSARIAAFDFDGCLVNTNVRIMGAHAWSLMFENVPSVLQQLHEAGYKIVIFTNESNIDRFTKQRQKAIESKIGRLTGFMQTAPDVPMQIFISCGRSHSGDLFRKPEGGLWHLLWRCLNGGVGLDMGRSFFVGDAAGRLKDHSDSDRVFAQNLRLPFYLPEEIFGASPSALSRLLTPPPS